MLKFHLYHMKSENVIRNSYLQNISPSGESLHEVESKGRLHSRQVKHFLWKACSFDIIFSAWKTSPNKSKTDGMFIQLWFYTLAIFVFWLENFSQNYLPSHLGQVSFPPSPLIDAVFIARCGRSLIAVSLN